MIETGNPIEDECPRDESIETEIDFDRALRITKRDKRNAKSALMKTIRQLTCRLSEGMADKREIIEELHRIEKQKDEVFTILDHMEEIYTKIGDKVNAEKVIDKGEVINYPGKQ